MKNVLLRVKKLVAAGHQQRFELLADELEAKVVLPAELQAQLNKLGTTPLDEPELADKIDASSTEGTTDLALYLLTLEEINTYSATEVGDFIHLVSQRVTDLKKEDGTFKSTSATENCELPNFIEAAELVKLGDRQRLAKDKLQESGWTEADAIKEFGEVSKQLQEKAFEISKLSIEGLTEWEKLLVATQIYATSVDASLGAVGKRLKR